MIVRDTGDAWQIVLQPDHAVLSEQLCRSWGNEEIVAPAPLQSLAVASRRHDDGWAVWERSPALDPESGQPLTFLEVQVPLHLAFYRAAISAVSEEDAYAGLLVSMHGAGIYRGRYGSQSELKLKHAADVKELVDVFVDEQEADFDARISELELAEDERWINYRFLQVYDRLSLYFCMKDLDGGEADTLKPIPTDYAGEETELAIEPLGAWHVSMDPFPFAGTEAEFTLDRYVLPKDDWESDAAFREAFFSSPVERTAITVTAAA